MSTSVIPLNRAGQNFYVPAFEISLNGRPADRAVVRDLTEVSYEDSLEAIDSFTLTLNNFDSDHLRAQFVGEGASESAWQQVQPGNGVQLKLGYQGDLRLMTTGFITALDVDFPETGATKLTVRGLNVLDRFRDRQYTWSWPAGDGNPMKDSEIAVDLGQTPDSPAGHPGLAGISRVRTSAAAASREQPQAHVFMNHQYPIVFLMQLARRNGYDVVFELGDDGSPQLYFGPTQDIADRTYVLELGRTLTSLKATVSTARQVKKVTVLGWNRQTKTAVHGEATVDADGADLPATVRALARATGREEVITDDVVSTDAQAKAKAVTQLHAIASRLVEVEAVVIGLPDLRAGRRVRLQRIGAHLSGDYFITSTKHVMNDAGYRTTFKARMEGPQTGGGTGTSSTSGAGSSTSGSSSGGAA